MSLSKLIISFLVFKIYSNSTNSLSFLKDISPLLFPPQLLMYIGVRFSFPSSKYGSCAVLSTRAISGGMDVGVGCAYKGCHFQLACV